MGGRVHRAVVGDDRSQSRLVSRAHDSFRDLKRMLGMTQVMNKWRHAMEKMLALLALVYAIGLLVRGSRRDALYGQPIGYPPSADVSMSQPKNK